MNARVRGWRIAADVVRDLASNPHRVEVVFHATSTSTGAQIEYSVEMDAADAADLGAFLDSLASALVACSDADECDRCGMPCDPGEAHCPTCEDER